MKNKVVGGLIISIALLIGFIVFLFNKAMTQIVGTSCSHGSECVMWQTIEFQTNVGIGIMVFVILVGVYLVFFSKEKKQHKIVKENYEEIMSKLNDDLKLVYSKIIEGDGTLFQSDLVEKSGLNKVKVTRLLDRLEGKGLIERKRRGMTNVVILKHK